MKELREFTSARVGLGRAGDSLSTAELLDFQLAHARARDAVHCAFDPVSLELPQGITPIVVHSAARDRAEYLRRPDLGRRLDPESKHTLKALAGAFDLVLTVADGLSAAAVHRHAAAVLAAALEKLDPAAWRIAPVILASQGRVAIADEIGAILGAALSVILIGERPGLSSPDSLGIYLTWSPRPGRTDAERNCISNIHAAGLNPGAAAGLLVRLMNLARSRELSGVALAPLSTGLLRPPAF